MVEIHLFGKLRRYGDGKGHDHENVVNMKPADDDTVESLLARTGIPRSEIYHVFYNRKILATHNTMARTLGYRQERDDPNDWDLNVPVKAGDRIALFGRDMAALVV